MRGRVQCLALTRWQLRGVLHPHPQGKRQVSGKRSSRTGTEAQEGTSFQGEGVQALWRCWLLSPLHPCSNPQP